MASTRFAKEEHHQALVVIGSFNPSIFQPSWLSSKGLVGDLEASNAKNLLIHNELARMELDWMELEVTPERFILKSTQEAYFTTLRDLLVNIFTILGETPIKAMGINSILHYRFENQDERDRFAWFVSPRDIWQKVLVDPRILKTEMMEYRNTGVPGHFRISLEVSEILKEVGCKFSMNSHFEFNQLSGSGTVQMREVVANNWSETMDRSKKIPNDLWSEYSKLKQQP